MFLKFFDDPVTKLEDLTVPLSNFFVLFFCLNFLIFCEGETVVAIGGENKEISISKCKILLIPPVNFL